MKNDSDENLCVEAWLSKSGLGYAIENFRMAGIVSPRSFVELELSYYEPLGIKRPEDRKKLFFLIQKVKLELEKAGSQMEEGLRSKKISPINDTNKTKRGYIRKLADFNHHKEGLNSFDKTSLNLTHKAPSPRSKSAEVGMSVETDSQKMEQISPVTLASTLSKDYDYENTPPNCNIANESHRKDSLSINLTLNSNMTRSSEIQSTQKEYSETTLHKYGALKQHNQQVSEHASNKFTEENSDAGNSNQYTDDYHEWEVSLASDGGSRSYQSRRSSSRRSSVVSVSAQSRRCSMLPRIDRSKNSLEELDQLDKEGRNKPHTKSISPAEVPNLHSRPTMKTKNHMTTHTISANIEPSADSDDESINSNASGLSSSIKSFHTLGSSTSENSKWRRSTAENNPLNRIDEDRQRGIMDTKAPISSRIRNKRLSTIPSTTIAPVSPLACLSLTQLDDSIETQPNRMALHKPSLASRRKSLRNTGSRPGTSRSLNSMPKKLSQEYLGGINSSFGSASTTRSMRSALSARSAIESGIDYLDSTKSLPRPLSRQSIQESLGNNKSLAFKCPKSRSPTSSSQINTLHHSRSIAKNHYKQSNSPYNSMQGRAISPARNVIRTNPQTHLSSPALNASSPVSKVQCYRSKSPPPSRSHSPARSCSPRHDRIANKTKHLDRSVTPIDLRSPKSIEKTKIPSISTDVYVQGQPEDDSWGTQITKLREEYVREHARFMNGREAYNEDDEYDMRIRVIVRKRPLSKREAIEMGDIDVIHALDYDDHGRVLVYHPRTKLDLAKEVEAISFAFDNVFNENSSNIDIYTRSVQNLIPGIFLGKWASVFAFGQTGSGKTFTMMGSNMTGLKAGNQHENETEANFGLYFLAARDVFLIAQEPEYKDISVSVSLFEIYGGKLIDLLNRRNPIKCLEDKNGKVCFPGLTEHTVYNANELMDAIVKGAINRSTGTTSANADSSRSHAVLQLSLRKNGGKKSKDNEYGRLTFIDLAGSERGADTNQASKTTRMEGAEINTSLLALKEVIRALATGSSMRRIPFRGSKLTQVLKDSFIGKNTRTVMVSCVAPNMKNCDHTLNTLRYADRVKERNPHTGELSLVVKAHSRMKKDHNDLIKVKLPSRPLTAPAKSFRYDDSDDSSEDKNIPPPPPHEGFQSFDTSSVFEDIEDAKSVRSDTIVATTLDDSNFAVSKRKSICNESDIQGSARQSGTLSENREARSLISTHRTIMSTMLSMVKHEMSLVNKTDANRANIDEYLKEVDNLTKEHLSLISALRESLMKYHAFKASSSSGTISYASSSYKITELNEYLDLGD